MPPLLSKVTVQSVVTMTDTELSCTAYPAMPSWVDTSVLVGISCDTPAVQVNGKLKGTVTVPVDSDEAAVVAAAMESDKVKKATEGMSVVKTILVRNKLVNLIVKPAK